MTDGTDKGHIGRVRMTSGWHLAMREDHEYFTKNRGWVRASDLQLGDQLDICAQDDEVAGFTVIDEVHES